MANHRRINEAQEQEIIELHNQGHAASVIARTLDVPVKTLYSTMRRMGLELVRTGRRSGVTPLQISEMVGLYMNGMNTTEIGEKYNLSASTTADYLRDAGVTIRPAGFRHGEDHHAWVGGRHVDENGYVYVWLRSDDPFFCMVQKGHGDAGGYVLEHRLVMAKYFGRPLREDETVHHINDKEKSNNHIDNLQLRQGKHGKGGVLRCADCGSHNLVPEQLAVH